MALKRLALATSSQFPALTSDDRPLVKKLGQLGIEAHPAVWDSPRLAWANFDAIVLRSCWDYHTKLDKFLDWLADIEEQGIPLFNSAETVRWNCNKRYLKRLQSVGVPIVPTVWLGNDFAVSLSELMQDRGWEEAVVKPAVGATAYKTWLTGSGKLEADQQRLVRMVRDQDSPMIQKFMPEIVTRGEWSLIFFQGAFSHAVLQRPKPGDFRVQTDFGGRLVKAKPSAVLIEQAQIALEQAPGATLYARVDGLEIKGKLILMELELIEPALFLDCHFAAVDNFAEAIAALTG